MANKNIPDPYEFSEETLFYAGEVKKYRYLGYFVVLVWSAIHGPASFMFTFLMAPTYALYCYMPEVPLPVRIGLMLKHGAIAFALLYVITLLNTG